MEFSAARHSGKAATIVCLAPDVCLTPVGNAVVPIPYMIISKLDWSVTTATSTILTGQEAFTMASRTDKVTGDEPGTKGGVKSGVNKGYCRPISKKTNVFVEGNELIQNDNLYDMNCNGQTGPAIPWAGCVLRVWPRRVRPRSEPRGKPGSRGGIPLRAQTGQQEGVRTWQERMIVA